MTREDIIRMAREADRYADKNGPSAWRHPDEFAEFRDERFAALVAAAEREACEKKTGEFARKWWSIHCASNKHMETTRKAHDDFCALQAAIRARSKS